MNTQEAYKMGFLFRCAVEGLSPEQTAERVKTAAEKRADPQWYNPLTWPGVNAISAGTKEIGSSIGKGLASGVTGLGAAGVITALAAPPAIGALGGYALAKSQDDAYDVDDAKRDEELAEYYRAIEQLSRRAKPAAR